MPDNAPGAYLAFQRTASTQHVGITNAPVGFRVELAKITSTGAREAAAIVRWEIAVESGTTLSVMMSQKAGRFRA
jgi:hypothetical protein